MSTSASAVTTVDSAPTELPQLSTLTSEQRQTWKSTGEMPTKQDSAPAKKDQQQDPAAPESAPDKKTDKSAVNASDSATEKDTQKPHLKTKEDTERRIQQLLDENKEIKKRLEAAERAKPSDEKRDTKQVSQPASEVKIPGLKTFLDQYFANAENKGKSYEDGVEAWQMARDTERGKQIEGEIRQQLAREAATRELTAKVNDGKQRYADFDEKVWPTLKTITEDAQIPLAIKAMIDGSDVLVDLVYTLGSDAAELKKFTDLCKANPQAAIRKLVTTEALVQEQLKGKGKTDTSTTRERDENGKFRSQSESGEKTEKPEAAAQPISKAPRPPHEVGGRGTAAEDGAVAAVKANDFRSAKAAFDRDYAASHK
jgi:hypothetical protein